MEVETHLPEPAGTEGAFPSSHQPSITLLPSAGPIPFGIWQYFLPPVNGLAQTEDPQPSLESCTLLMGRPPKAAGTVLGVGGMSPQAVALHRAWLGSAGHSGMPQPCANRVPVLVHAGVAFWLQAPSLRRDVGRWGPWWEAGPILSPLPTPGLSTPR